MKSEQSKAAFPHQLLILNLLVFNILVPLVAILNNMERTLLPIAIACSIFIIVFIAIREKTIKQTRLIKAQWHIVWMRCRIILIAYAISVSIELLSSFMASFQTDPKLAQIMMIAFSRVAIIPTLLVVTPLLILSTIAMTKVRLGKYSTTA